MAEVAWRRAPWRSFGTLLASTGPGRVMRYSAVSIISIVLTQAVLAVLYGVAGWGAVSANAAACSIAAVPAYALNRSWVWNRTGRSRMGREVLAFWLLAIAGLVASLVASQWVHERAAASAASRTLTTTLVVIASSLAFGVVWVAKYLVLNLVFADRGEKR